MKISTFDVLVISTPRNLGNIYDFSLSAHNLCHFLVTVCEMARTKKAALRAKSHKLSQ